MTVLHETLEQLKGTLLDRQPGAADLVKSAEFSAEQYLQLHQNNIYVSLTEALADIYPVVARLVGEDFFRAACRDYIPLYPPRAATMLSFGAEFADFLHQYPPAKPLEYLHDVACLEWAWHESFHAADAPLFNADILNRVDVNDHGKLKFELHPAARLFHSEFPLYRMWLTNQEGYTGDDRVGLDDGPAFILIVRPRLDVQVQCIDPAEWFFLNALSTGECLDDAYDIASAKKTGFDLATLLKQRVSDRTLVQATL